MSKDNVTLDYGTRASDESTTSWLAVCSVILGCLAIPCVANVILPDGIIAWLPRGSRQSTPPAHLLVLPTLSVLFGALGLARILTSRGSKRGVPLAACGIGLGICWLGLVMLVWLVTRNMSFGPGD